MKFLNIACPQKFEKVLKMSVKSPQIQVCQVSMNSVHAKSRTHCNKHLLLELNEALNESCNFHIVYHLFWALKGGATNSALHVLGISHSR